jgi:orotate phosphoribosyltransferase-like protein
MSEKSAVAKKPGKEINKSEEIRKVATSMKAKGEKPRPVAIIATLKKQGVVVSSPQVSMVLKRMGFRPRKRRKAAHAPMAGKVAAGKAAPSRTSVISVDDLINAKKVASTFGGADRAIAALSALKHFER